MNRRLQVEYRPIESVLPYARNPRIHTPKQIGQVAKSIDFNGFINPILVDPNKVVIAGHARLLAAQQLGLEVVPVICIEHLTEDEIQAYRIADNKLAEPAAVPI